MKNILLLFLLIVCQITYGQLTKKELNTLHKAVIKPVLSGQLETMKPHVQFPVEVTLDSYTETLDMTDFSEMYLALFHDELLAAEKSTSTDRIVQIDTRSDLEAVAYISNSYTKQRIFDYRAKEVTAFVFEHQNNDWKLVSVSRYDLHGDPDYRKNIQHSIEEGYAYKKRTEKVYAYMDELIAGNSDILLNENNEEALSGEAWRTFAISCMEGMSASVSNEGTYIRQQNKTPKKYNELSTRQCLDDFLTYAHDALELKAYEPSGGRKYYRGYPKDRDFDFSYLESSYDLEYGMNNIISLDYISMTYEKEGELYNQRLSLYFGHDESGNVFIMGAAIRTDEMSIREQEEEYSQWEEEYGEYLEEEWAEEEEWEETEEVEAEELSEEEILELELAIEEAMEEDVEIEEEYYREEEHNDSLITDFRKNYVSKLIKKDYNSVLSFSDATVFVTDYSIDQPTSQWEDEYVDPTKQLSGDELKSWLKENLTSEIITELSDEDCKCIYYTYYWNDYYYDDYYYEEEFIDEEAPMVEEEYQIEEEMEIEANDDAYYDEYGDQFAMHISLSTYKDLDYGIIRTEMEMVFKRTKTGYQLVTIERNERWN